MPDRPRDTRGGPKLTSAPEGSDVVQVLMTEEMARRFERHCLGANTRGWTQLSPPLLFSKDDVPTYIIQVGPSDPEAPR